MKLLHLTTTISPLFLALVFSLSSSTPSPSQSSLLSLQLISLLSLKSSLKDPLLSLHDWEISNPKFQDPIWCSWSGIKCNPKTAQITSLDLSHKNLSGELSIIKFKYLSSLVHLNLSSNSFDCPFPSTVFELTQLRTLDLSHNNFNSTFPPGVSKIKFLKTFNAYSNGFTGTLPEEFVKLRYLEQLNLGGSYFQGSIPASYGSFTRIKFLHLAGNLLEGPLPGNLGYITELEHLEIGYNKYNGGIPVEFSYLSNLTYMDISQANLSGDLTPQIGNLTALATLFLFKNQFSGKIPESFSNLKSIESLDLSDNNLSSNIPAIFTEMKKLNMLSLMNNNLTGEIPESIGDLPNLEILSLWNNSLTGILPQKLGSNGRLTKLDVSSNFLTGPIPQNLCIGNRLEKVILFSNKFIANLPNSLANCTSLIRLRVQDNFINGSIPGGLGLLPNLTFVDLSSNKFAGNIPADLGYALKLQYLNISENLFESSLPDSIWSGPSLQVFIASSCKIVGKIPDFVGCKSVYRIELDGNLLNGSIPWNVDHCWKLLRLNLRRNLLNGIIPWEISTLPSITDVDLSHNFLSGTIPSNFNNCTTLENFNVSYNLLTGPIPSSGAVFSNLHSSSFSGNVGLCGGMIEKQCTSATPGGNSLAFESTEDHRKKHSKKTAGAIVWITAGAFGIGLLLLIASARCFHANYNDRFSRDVDSHRKIGPWKLTAFQRLNFTANDVLECLSMSDKILGMGSTGTVYKAEMPNGEIIAVKRLWGKHKETARRRRGVLAEVEVLGNVRHRNIVRLLGCCSNRESTMLLYEYMPNGSLEDLLHGKNKGDNLIADWFTRYKIALGVAQGICYLHHDCDPVIVHRDLNPSNILIDSEMEARVADFGVAKLIMCDESMSVIAGSYGYIAPEYAYTLQVDEKSDIYSYGVVLLEILTGKRSVNAEFGDGNSIVDWVRSKMKTKDGIVIRDILDKKTGASCVSVREEMMLLLRVALLCTSRNPADRPSMRDVVSMLQEARPQRKLPESGGGGNVLPQKSLQGNVNN